jgi:hypothetical protein
MTTPDKHKAKFLEAIERKVWQQVCPFCHMNYVPHPTQREVGKFVEVFTKNPETDETLTETVSMVQLVCKNCGYVQLFHREYLLA